MEKSLPGEDYFFNVASKNCTLFFKVLTTNFVDGWISFVSSINLFNSCSFHLHIRNMSSIGFRYSLRFS